MSARYEVRQISLGSEIVVAAFDALGEAWDECVSRWTTRKAGSPIYAVRDTETEQRWSYADIKDLRGSSRSGSQA